MYFVCIQCLYIKHWSTTTRTHVSPCVAVHAHPSPVRSKLWQVACAKTGIVQAGDDVVVPNSINGSVEIQRSREEDIGVFAIDRHVLPKRSNWTRCTRYSGKCKTCLKIHISDDLSSRIVKVQTTSGWVYALASVSINGLSDLSSGWAHGANMGQHKQTRHPPASEGITRDQKAGCSQHEARTNKSCGSLWKRKIYRRTLSRSEILLWWWGLSTETCLEQGYSGSWSSTLI